MLRYQLKRQVFDSDWVVLNYSAMTFNDYVTLDDDKILVELDCNDARQVETGNVLTYVTTLPYYNEDLGKYGYVGDTGKAHVSAVNYLTNKVYFVDDKYMELEISNIYAEIETNTSSERIMTWVIEFEKSHLFGQFDLIDLHLVYGVGKSVHLYSGIPGLDPDKEPSSTNPPSSTSLTMNPTYDNYFRIKWVYDETVENASELSSLLFGSLSVSGDMSVNGVVESRDVHVKCLRKQMRWVNSTLQTPPTVILKRYKVNLNVPISLKSEVCLHSEGNLKEYFVEHEEEKAINGPIEMERVAYAPVITTCASPNSGQCTSNQQQNDYTDCIQINFNLHFRVHDGDNWTVDDSDSWNFDKYGTGDEVHYYSYGYDAMSTDKPDSVKKSCQSDLLGYVGFTTNDVKYQKNKLRKSFLRLFYYDSDDPTTQSLLGYSTIFVDCNKLYSKFISKSSFTCYYDSNGDLVKGIKVNREVDEEALRTILGKKNVLPMETVEESRLSAQITTKNKYLSDNSSEGFYIYKWEGENEAVLPEAIYMKAEFNHAGYGRNIPMMAPYKDEQGGFKTNDDIIADWEDGGYGIRRYNRYSYIRLKSKIVTDRITKQIRHIYYIDPTVYVHGDDSPSFVENGNILNINLYEARISFNDSQNNSQNNNGD